MQHTTCARNLTYCPMANQHGDPEQSCHRQPKHKQQSSRSQSLTTSTSASTVNRKTSQIMKPHPLKTKHKLHHQRNNRRLSSTGSNTQPRLHHQERCHPSGSQWAHLQDQSSGHPQCKRDTSDHNNHNPSGPHHRKHSLLPRQPPRLCNAQCLQPPV